jgi:Flp pilus assembly pilin Flp
MNGPQDIPSMFNQAGEMLTMFIQYTEGCVFGAVFGVVLFYLARKIKADASWLVIPPVVSFVILPSMHASRVLLTAGVIATLIAVPFYGLKETGDFGIRDALENRWARIGASLLAGFFLLQLISIVVLIVGVLILAGLANTWWNHGLREFLEEFLQQDSQ